MNGINRKGMTFTMKITWLGQAGLLMETSGLKIIIDPYLSNSVVKINPKNYRRQPVDESFLKIKPDVVVCTHNHLDHVDPETLKFYLADTERSVVVLAPEAAWAEVKKFGGNHNYVQFNRHSSWTEGDVEFYSVKAQHSDIHPIGVIIKAEGKKYYITGDTLYNDDIFEDIPNDIDVMFVPINGVGNNMNMTDAKRFAQRVGAKTVVPVHWGLFDNLNPNDFKCENKVIPQMYKEINV